MAIKHNNVVPNVHFRKWWQRYVVTWFNQAGKKKSRRVKREQKKAKTFPRPTGLLRPSVHPPTQRYNFKVRAGRGFTKCELKAAGVPKKQALSLGIAVDHRRRSQTQETLDTNVARLKEYQSKMVLFPKKSGKPKKGDSSKEQLKAVSGETFVQNTCKTVIPIAKPALRRKARAITAADKESSAVGVLRKAFLAKLGVGRLVKKAKIDAEKEASKK